MILMLEEDAGPDFSREQRIFDQRRRLQRPVDNLARSANVSDRNLGLHSGT
jgi:hypothetical protein